MFCFKQCCQTVALICCFAPFPAHTAPSTQTLRAELEQLKQRIAELERRLNERTGHSIQEQAVVATAPKKPAVTAAVPPAPEPEVQIGGAVRLNYTWRDHNETLKDRFGDFELELFRIDADADIDNVLLSAQFRWYNDFEAIHHAWAGYQITPEWQIQAGIHQVPFGILPYASHSFWFSGAYYMGFEDDYDTGIKLLYEKQPWDFQVAFYKNAEYANSSRYGRYSFDLATGGDQANEEINQFNLRGAYRFNHSTESYTTAGLSAEWGELYNQITGRHGERYALAAHVDSHWGPWNFQLELIDYRFSPDNPAGVDNEVIQLAAFDFPFLMAAEAQVVTLNLARSFNVDWGAISDITCYNDHTRIFPEGNQQNLSVQNVTGCLVTAGGLYTYIDWIAGRNMWFAGGPGIGLASDDQWRSRLNINMGYYF